MRTGRRTWVGFMWVGTVLAGCGNGSVTLVQSNDEIPSLIADAQSIHYLTTSSDFKSSTLRRIPRDGGTPTVLGTTPFAGALGSDGTSLYFADAFSIWRLPPGAPAPVQVATGLHIKFQGQPSLAVDTQQLYWVDLPHQEGDVMRGPALMTLPTTGGTARRLIEGDFAALAEFAGHLVVLDTQGHLGVADPQSGAIAPITMLAGDFTLSSLPMIGDDQGLYWLDGGLYHAPWSGGAPARVADLPFAADGPLALDAGRVYFLVRGMNTGIEGPFGTGDTPDSLWSVGRADHSLNKLLDTPAPYTMLADHGALFWSDLYSIRKLQMSP